MVNDPADAIAFVNRHGCPKNFNSRSVDTGSEAPHNAAALHGAKPWIMSCILFFRQSTAPALQCEERPMFLGIMSRPDLIVQMGILIWRDLVLNRSRHRNKLCP